MDYKLLLHKYMRHVTACEGISFVDHSPVFSEVSFSEEEKKELSEIETEVYAEEFGHGRTL